jgi:tetratricopeptide (TPR) repeat protein
VVRAVLCAGDAEGEGRRLVAGGVLCGTGGAARSEIRHFADFHAQTLVRLGRHEEAIEAFRRCLRLRPKHYASLVTLATVLAADGRFEEALEQIDAAIEVRPRLTRAQNVRRDILQKTVRVEAADDVVVEDL